MTVISQRRQNPLLQYADARDGFSLYGTEISIQSAARLDLQPNSDPMKPFSRLSFHFVVLQERVMIECVYAYC